MHPQGGFLDGCLDERGAVLGRAQRLLNVPARGFGGHDEQWAQVCPVTEEAQQAKATAAASASRSVTIATTAR